MRYRLRTKLLGAALLYMVLLAGIGGFGVYTAQRNLSGLHTTAVHHVRELILVGEIRSAVSALSGTAALHVEADSDAERELYEDRLTADERELRRLLDALQVTETDSNDAADLRRLAVYRTLVEGYLRALDEQLLPASRAGDHAQAALLAAPDGAYGRAYEHARASLRELQAQMAQDSSRTVGSVEQEFTHNRDALVVAVLVCGLLGVLFALVHSRRLSQAIRELSLAAHEVAAGDLTQRVAIRTGDEVEDLAESFNRMTRELERLDAEHRRALAAREEFLGVAAHELNTPVGALLACSQLHLRRARQQPGFGREEACSALAEVHSQAQRLGRLVSQLLDRSRIDAGKLVIEPQAVDVGELVRGVVDRRRAVSAQRVISVEAPDGLEAVLDPLRIEQVVLNLLDNALKFSPADSPVRVRLDQPAPGAIRIMVRDHGPGIPPAHRAHIFERFYQAGAGRQVAGVTGLGLGLHICREIVELHAGELSAHFPPDGGSCFVVTLPSGARLERAA